MTDERIIAYLLEELPEEEAERFEEECFAEETLTEQVLLVEEDLIDDYLRGRLPPEQRRRFERNYLTTAARVERVRIAAALLRQVDAVEAGVETPLAAPSAPQTWRRRMSDLWKGRPWALRTAVVLAVVTIVAGAWWFSRRPGGLAPDPRSFATLTLNISSSDRAQGVEPGRVELPPEESGLRIILMLPERSASASRYRVELLDDQRRSKSLEPVEQDAQSVSVVIPSAQLSRGLYALRLYAVKADGTETRITGSYFFDVE